MCDPAAYAGLSVQPTMLSGNTSAKQIAAIYALTQYARSADLSRECMVAAMEGAPGLVPLRHLFVGRDGADISNQYLHMRLWFAFTYVVIEGWRDLALEDSSVNDAIKALDVTGDLQVLRRFRNAVFHLQPDPHSTKLTTLFERLGPDLMNRLLVLDVAVQRFFAHWRATTDLSTLAQMPVELLSGAA